MSVSDVDGLYANISAGGRLRKVSWDHQPFQYPGLAICYQHRDVVLRHNYAGPRWTQVRFHSCYPTLHLLTCITAQAPLAHWLLLLRRSTLDYGCTWGTSANISLVQLGHRRNDADFPNDLCRYHWSALLHHSGGDICHTTPRQDCTSWSNRQHRYHVRTLFTPILTYGPNKQPVLSSLSRSRTSSIHRTQIFRAE